MVRRRQLSICLLALALIAISVGPAFADPLANGEVAFGDRYAVTTISGEAHAWASGSSISSSADLQLVVHVTYVGHSNIVFRVLSGTIQFNGKVYNTVASGWRGDYNRVTRICIYQGPAMAPNGQRTFFIIYGQDTVSVQQGTYMRMWSVFHDEDRILWRIDLRTYRLRIN
jgi:hypothetical protein